MTTRDIHIRIEQGLSGIGTFAYEDINHDELDIAFNSVVYKEIRNVFRDIDGKTNSNNFERNQYYTDYLRVLKRSYENIANDEGDTSFIFLPDYYIHRINDYTILIDDNCKSKCLNGEKEKLKPNTFYKCITDVKYKDDWFYETDTFKTDDETSFYGSVSELNTRKVRNRLTGSEYIDMKLNSQLSRTKASSPISELINDRLIVHKKGFDVFAIGLTYIKKPIQIDYRNKSNEVNEFPDNIVHYFIEKTIQHIDARILENQGKLQNERYENIENT